MLLKAETSKSMSRFEDSLAQENNILIYSRKFPNLHSDKSTKKAFDKKHNDKSNDS